MWLSKGFKAVVKQYLSCIPCCEAVASHTRTKDTCESHNEQDKDNTELVTDQPKPILQPTKPSIRVVTNPKWAEKSKPEDEHLARPQSPQNSIASSKLHLNLPSSNCDFPSTEAKHGSSSYHIQTPVQDNLGSTGQCLSKVQIKYSGEYLRNNVENPTTRLSPGVKAVFSKNITLARGLQPHSEEELPSPPQFSNNVINPSGIHPIHTTSDSDSPSNKTDHGLPPDYTLTPIQGPVVSISDDQVKYSRKHDEDLMHRLPFGARAATPKKVTPVKQLRRQPKFLLPSDSEASAESDDEQPVRLPSPKIPISQMPNPILRSKKTPKNVVVPSDIHLFYSSSDCSLPSVQGGFTSTGDNLSSSGSGFFLSKRNLSSYGRDIECVYSDIDTAFSDDEDFPRSPTPETHEDDTDPLTPGVNTLDPQAPPMRISESPNLYPRSKKPLKHFFVPEDIHLFYISSDFDLRLYFKYGLPQALGEQTREASSGMTDFVAFI